MKRRFYFIWNYFLVVHFGIVIIPQFVISYFSIFIAYVFANVDIIVLILTAIYIKILFIAAVEFILRFIIILVMIFFRHFQSRIFFQFFFDPFFQIGRRHLQQFHKLNLLWRKFLE